MKFKKFFLVKVPKDIIIYYNKNKDLLICTNVRQVKSLKLKVKLHILEKSRSIIVTNNFSNLEFFKKQLSDTKVLQSFTVYKIRQIFLEISTVIYNKLILVGVGYRAHSIKDLLTLRLGFSHPIHIRPSPNINIKCTELTNIFFSSNSSIILLNQFLSFVKKHKPTEFYKGKGILYKDEKVVLKQGKKV